MVKKKNPRKRSSALCLKIEVGRKTMIAEEGQSRSEKKKTGADLSSEIQK